MNEKALNRPETDTLAMAIGKVSRFKVTRLEAQIFL